MPNKIVKSNSRELRGGVLYAACDCRRRNGLQYDCKRTGCEGDSKCLIKPFPKCCPSLYSNRMENISMGKYSWPDDKQIIRNFDNGRKFMNMEIPNRKSGKIK